VLAKLFNSRMRGAAPYLPVDHLSDRELEVFQLIGRGRNNAAIGDELHISHKTVEAHRTRIREKLGIASAAELIAVAARWSM
jgi:DNA-binding NarL/FixJ family response regulator